MMRTNIKFKVHFHKEFEIVSSLLYHRLKNILVDLYDDQREMTGY